MSLLGDAAPDFSDPLGLLAACHQRMLNHCQLLERMPAWLDEHGVDDEMQRGISSVLRYFNTAAIHHHEDEEQDLFPLLMKDPTLSALIERLQGEHRSLASHWRNLAAELDSLRNGHPTSAFANSIMAFTGAYRSHIDVENRDVLPIAATLLDEGQLHRLGVAMARRRSVTSME